MFHKVFHTLKTEPFFLGCCIMATFPLFPIKSQIVLFVLFGVFTVCDIVQNGMTDIKKNLSHFICLSSLFFIYLISLFFIDDQKAGGRIVERSLSMLLFPLAFWLRSYKINKQHIKIILFCFAISTIVITLYGWLNIGLRGIRYDSYVEADFVYMLRTDFSLYTRIHPVYVNFLVFLSSSVLFYYLIEELNDEFNISRFLVYLSSISFLVVSGLFIATRTPIAAFLMIAALIVFVVYRTSLRNKILFFVLSCLVAIGSVFFVPTLKQRMEDSLKADSGETNYTNIRFQLLDCSKELFFKSPLLGYGLGNGQKVLDNCYQKNRYQIARDGHYNAHNQYFTLVHRVGIIGLLFLSLLFLFLVRSGNSQYVLPTCIALYVFCCLLTESYLERQVGIVSIFYVFSLFIFNPIGKLEKK